MHIGKKGVDRLRGSYKCTRQSAKKQQHGGTDKKQQRHGRKLCGKTVAAAYTARLSLPDQAAQYFCDRGNFEREIEKLNRLVLNSKHTAAHDVYAAEYSPPIRRQSSAGCLISRLSVRIGAHSVFAPAECLLRRPQYTSRRMEFPACSLVRQVVTEDMEEDNTTNTSFVSAVYVSNQHVTKILHFLNTPVLGDTYSAEHAFFFSKALFHACAREVLADVAHTGVAAARVVLLRTFGVAKVSEGFVEKIPIGCELFNDTQRSFFYMTFERVRFAQPPPAIRFARSTLVDQVHEALRTLHAHGIFHLDIAERNVLVDEYNGQPVLIDFVNADNTNPYITNKDIENAQRLWISQTRTAGTGPVGTGPVGTGPAGTGPAGTGPAGTGPAGTAGSRLVPASGSLSTFCTSVGGDHVRTGTSRHGRNVLR